jgi:hypothetical protein
MHLNLLCGLRKSILAVADYHYPSGLFDSNGRGAPVLNGSRDVPLALLRLGDTSYAAS